MIKICKDYLSGNKKVFKPVLIISFLFTLMLFMLSMSKSIIKYDISNQFSFLGKNSITIIDKKIDTFKDADISYSYTIPRASIYYEIDSYGNKMILEFDTLCASNNINDFNKTMYTNVCNVSGSDGIYLPKKVYNSIKDKNESFILSIDGVKYNINIAGYLSDKKQTRIYKCYDSIKNNSIYMPMTYFNSLGILSDDITTNTILTFDDYVSYDEYLSIEACYPNEYVYSYVNEIEFYNDIVSIFVKVVRFLLESIFLIGITLLFILNLVLYYFTESDRRTRYLLGQTRLSMFMMNAISLLFVSVLAVICGFISSLGISLILNGLGLKIEFLEGIKMLGYILLLYAIVEIIGSTIIVNKNGVKNNVNN